MSGICRAAALAAFALTALTSLAASGAEAAVPAPAWSIQSLSTPTNFVPGEPEDSSKQPRYQVFITNSGGKSTDRTPITITDTLPAGLAVKEVQLLASRGGTNLAISGCQTATDAGTEVSTISCEVSEPTPPKLEPARLSSGDAFLLEVKVAVPLSASGTLVNRVEVQGGGAEPATAESQNKASSEDAEAGFEEFKAELTGVDGQPATAADSRPYQYTTSFGVNLVPTPPESSASFVPAQGDLKQVEVALPPGLAGNPTAAPRCSARDFTHLHNIFSTFRDNFVTANECPESSVVGLAILEVMEGESFFNPRPIYNLVPPPGMPAQFGFEAVHGAPIYINTKVRSDSDYGVSAYLQNVTQAERISAGRFMFWGSPWDASHDRVRGICAESWETCPAEGEGTPRPFLRAPSSCANPLATTMSFTTWAQPVTGASATSTQAAPTECEKPPFEPTIEARPTTNVADAPSGLHVDVHLPQKANEDIEGLGEADLKDTTVTLPEGLLVNPSSADGLGACSASEIGLTTPVGQSDAHFSAEPANCPDAAKLGTVAIHSPLVDHPLPGAVYLAMPHENPFDSLLAIYIAVNDPETGVVVKLPGKVSPDPSSGKLTTTVEQSPQLPFEDFELDFFEGARAPLRTPSVCGTHTTTASFTPWTAPEGSSAFPTSSFETTTAPAGQSACPASASAEPNSPSFTSGALSPIAGAYTPFVLRLSRRDGSQELKGLNVTLPAGMAAKFAGVAECPDAAIASAEEKSGKEEQASPSCPSASHLGTVTVGAGAGPAPYYVKGDAYLAGPYRGAPLSMAVLTPAVAGPFDLGTVVVRAPLFVDPETAQGTVKSSFPTILQGIPLDIRSVAVSIDRQDFTLNPTSCEAKAVGAEAISTQGQTVPLTNRFQVGGCANLGFKPKLSLRLRGGTKRGGHPALTATLTYPKGGAYANIAYAQVALPHSEFLDQAHIGTVCTRVQFAAKQCPARSVYGFARAVTPLFDKPLEGPVYLRSSSHQLPDLVADLNGQVEVVLDGRNDSIHGGIRNTFEAVPDAPVSKFTLSLKGAKKGLLENSTDICQGTHKANARFVAHNGKAVVLRPELVAQCGGKSHKSHGHKR